MAQTPQWVLAAREAMKAGDLSRAAALYDQGAQQESRSVVYRIEAINRLLQCNRSVRALALAADGIDRFGQVALWQRLAMAWFEQGARDEADLLQRQLLDRFSGVASLYRDRARLLLAHGQLAAARGAAQRALMLESGPEGLLLLGRIEQQRGDRQAAEVIYSRILQTDGAHTQAAIGLLETLLARRATQRALRLFVRLKEQVRAPEELWLWVANRNYRIGRAGLAERYYRRALKVRSGFVPALSNLGVLYKEQGQNDAARACYQEALEVAPNDSAANNNYGVLLKQEGAFDQAQRCFEKALATQPAHADALSNLGALAKARFEDARAVAYYQQALKVNPEHINAHVDLAMILLAHGHYPQGWQHYEWRLKMRELAGKLAPWRDSVLWHNQSLEGKTIAIQTEQGFGDVLQFVRFVRGLKARGAAKVGVRTRTELVSLLEAMEGVDWVVDESSPPPAHDLFVPIMSLAGRLGITLSDLPYATGYLPTPEGKPPFELDAKRLKVGLCYAGSPTFKEAAAKRVAIEAFGFLADSRVQVVNLQVGQESAAFSQLKLPGSIDRSDQLRDFADTARVVSQLDLVISADTSVAHLAGGLNRPVWVLVSKKGSDWRWMTRGDQSPWYPSARLFRQEDPQSWEAPIQAMAEAFKGWLQTARKEP